MLPMVTYVMLRVGCEVDLYAELSHFEAHRQELYPVRLTCAELFLVSLYRWRNIFNFFQWPNGWLN